MKIIDEFVNEYENFRETFDYQKNCAYDVFKKTMQRGSVDEDTYSAANAFTSIVNQIINRKIEYGNFIIAGQIELLTFLNTYDDKYLSNTKNLIECQNANEQVFLAELDEDICNILLFLEDFLKKLVNKNKEFKMEDELSKFLKELGDKNKRGEI